MSAGGTRLEWAAAASIAEQLVKDLMPVVARVKTVGSIRRRRKTVGDIELLIEPEWMIGGLFGDDEGPDLERVRDVIPTWGGRLLKNGSRFIQVEIADRVHIDLYLCYAPAQWGSLLAIRTGPAQLGQHAVTLMTERGLRHRDGHVERRDGSILPTPTEEDFFAAAGLPCLPPSRRDTPAAYKQIQEVARA